jgi:LmbE family N-acetylglucosaminyl deacetylase
MLSACETRAADLLRGVVLIAVPHMDDAVLACGGTIAQLPDRERIHLLYATDGARSPEPVVPGRDRVEVDLFAIRKAEARAALGHLGVPEPNLHFLGLPDCRLRRHARELEEGLGGIVERIRPDCVLAPFRFDRHPDHLAVNRAVLRRLARPETTTRIIEYFVYHHWRLLPRKDVRAYLRPGLLRRVAIQEVSEIKRSALDRFESQTTRFFEWQSRPNLTSELLDEASGGAEYFLPYEAELSGTRVFTGSRTWIRIAHRLEPFLKRHKDRVVALARRGRGAAPRGRARPRQAP